MKSLKVFSFIVALSLIFTFTNFSVNAEVTEQSVGLTNNASGIAQGHLDGASGFLVLGWANNPGMKFDVLADEALVAVNIQTVVKDKQVRFTLYKWNTSITDKVKLEEKEFTSTDWTGVEFTFDNVYPSGTYYIMVTSLTEVPEPYLSVYKDVVQERNIEAYQGSKTFAQLNTDTGRDFGKGFNMSIILYKGITDKAQAFLNKYYEVKAAVASGATIYDQDKYDAVMNTFEGDMKTFVRNASDTTFTNYTNDLTEAMTEAIIEAPTNVLSYFSMQLRTTLVPYKDKSGNIVNNDKRQGLRFCFDVANVGETFIYEEKTYEILSEGALIIKKTSLSNSDLMTVSQLNIIAGLLKQDVLIDINFEGTIYKSAYIYNIPESAKDTVICARAYLECKDDVGNIVYFYSAIQEKSLTDVYDSLVDAGKADALDSDVTAWWQGGV